MSIIKEKEILDRKIDKLKAYRKKYGDYHVPPNWKEDKQFSQWVENIRKHPEKVPLKLRTSLKSIGFDFNLPSDWNYMFSLLQDFYDLHGNSQVPPPLQVQYERLFAWTIQQRESKSTLTKDQIRRLNSVRFEWESLSDNDLRWQARFHELIAFKSLYGHTRVPSTFSNKPLAGWVSKQRENEKSLSVSRKTMLDSVGFYWYKDILELDEKAWLEKYEELRLFFKKYKHFKIPTNGSGLHSLRIWVDKQRVAEMAMPSNRKTLLREINFPWNKDIKKGQQKDWNAMYDKLLLYSKEYGNCLVSSHSKKYPELGSWVSRQRKRWDILDKAKKKKLEKIGFVTSYEIEKEKRKKWLTMLSILKRYKRANTHCRVPSSYEQNPELGRWVEVQRLEEKRLPEWKIKFLNALDFEWSRDIRASKEKRWYEIYGRLEKFYKRFGHSSVPEYWQEDEKLSIWVMYQRRPKLPLTVDKIKLLKKLSFEFKARTTAERKRSKLGHFINEV